MNIAESENESTIIAKTCGNAGKSDRKVTYSIIETYHNFCLDKKDILLAQIEACEKLANYATDEDDKRAVQKEIAELRIALDLISASISSL